MTAIPVIIDTDPGLGVIAEGRPRDVDDAFAIVEAIRSPRIDLVGLTITYGNVDLVDGVRVARELVDLAGVDVPVHPGAEGPLGAAEMDRSGATRTGAVAFLQRAVRQRPGLRIAAIGPLTNLGALLRIDPEVARFISEVVIVAGRTQGRQFYLGDVGPVRDFNFENDARAARILLESGIPIVMAGFELSSRITVTPADLEVLRQRTTPVSAHLYELSQPWMRFWTATFPDDRGFHPWDSAAIAWILRPETFVTEARGWQIREATLRAEEWAENPDRSPRTVPLLETSTALPGPRITYCTGLRHGSEAEFVRASLAEIT